MYKTTLNIDKQRNSLKANVTKKKLTIALDEEPENILKPSEDSQFSYQPTFFRLNSPNPQRGSSNSLKSRSPNFSKPSLKQNIQDKRQLYSA